MGMSSGSHTRVHSWAADLAGNIKITASRFDAENDDFSSSLGVMIARDGQSTITANIPFSNFKPTGVTAASALDQFTTYADVNTGRPNFITVVETTADNSISGVGAIAITAYTTGQPVFWIPGFNNTGGATLTISGLSAASVLAGGAALTSGMLLSGVPAMVVSDGSGWHCMNPQRAPANFITGAAVQDNSITLAKLQHETAQGSIVYTGASGTPTYLAPGTSGQFLQSGGASANPSWGAGAGDLLAANNLSDVTTAATAFINIKQDASATATGVVELSTDAELATGTDTSRAVTPANIESLIVGKTDTSVAAGDSILFEDVTDNTLKKDTVQGILDLVSGGWTEVGTTATTSGTSSTISGITAAVKDVLIIFDDVSPDAAAEFQLQIGDAGGLETSGYVGTSHRLDGTTPSTLADTTHFLIANAGSTADTLCGHVHLTRAASGTNAWVASWQCKQSTAATNWGEGTKTLSAELTQIGILLSTGSFDAGAWNVYTQ